MTYRVAVLGATGLVGRRFLDILGERAFPVGELVPLASRRSVGKEVRFGDAAVPVRLAEPAAFDGVDLVLSSAGASVSRELLPAATARGAVAIDNTSAFRMEPDVPLVVPEVNPDRVREYVRRGIIANPNCSTIQLVVVLKPLHDAFTVRRVIASTYQSVSGAGQSKVDALVAALGTAGAHELGHVKAHAGDLAFNAWPQIDHWREDGDTREEWKMRAETSKIMEAEIPLHATCVRVPVVHTHSEAVWIETERPVSPEEARAVLAGSPGIEMVDDRRARTFPTSAAAAGEDPVLVGRIRRDPTTERGLALWIVADNLRKGAALNAIQIAELLVAHWREHGRHRASLRGHGPADRAAQQRDGVTDDLNGDGWDADVLH